MLFVCCEAIIASTESITLFETSRLEIDIWLDTPALLTVVDTMRIVSGSSVGKAEAEGSAIKASKAAAEEVESCAVADKISSSSRCGGLATLEDNEFTVVFPIGDVIGGPPPA